VYPATFFGCQQLHSALQTTCVFHRCLDTLLLLHASNILCRKLCSKPKLHSWQQPSLSYLRPTAQSGWQQRMAAAFWPRLVSQPAGEACVQRNCLTWHASMSRSSRSRAVHQHIKTQKLCCLLKAQSVWHSHAMSARLCPDGPSGLYYTPDRDPGLNVRGVVLQSRVHQMEWRPSHRRHACRC